MYRQVTTVAEPDPRVCDDAYRRLRRNQARLAAYAVSIARLGELPLLPDMRRLEADRMELDATNRELWSAMVHLARR